MPFQIVEYKHAYIKNVTSLSTLGHSLMLPTPPEAALMTIERTTGSNSGLNFVTLRWERVDGALKFFCSTVQIWEEPAVSNPLAQSE